MGSGLWAMTMSYGPAGHGPPAQDYGDGLLGKRGREKCDIDPPPVLAPGPGPGPLTRPVHPYRYLPTPYRWGTFLL